MEGLDNRNLIIAVVLAIVILFGSQFLFPHHKVPTQLATPAEQAARTGGSVSIGGGGELSEKSRQDALKESAGRVPVETAHFRGSINLTAGRVDDLALVGYHETIKPDSPWIVLLSPTGAAHAYISQQGWIAQDQSVTKLPGDDTVWQAQQPGGADAKLTTTNPVTLTYDNGEGLKFTRTISVDDAFMFTIKDEVANSGTKPVTLIPYSLIARSGEAPKTGTWISYEGPLGGFDNGGEAVKYSSLHQGQPNERSSVGGWVGFTDKYWLTAVAPKDQHEQIQARFSHVGETGPAQKFQADWMGQAATIVPGASTSASSYLFAGAKEVNLINSYTNKLGLLHFDTAVDWGWFWFITKPIFFLLDLLYSWVGNFGIAILMLTVVIKALFFPLANRAFVNMAKMKKLAPEMQKLKEKFGDDKLRLQQETMVLYKRIGANPVLGCLPIMLQIPVFFSLYKVLYNTIEMRHAPFYGWIHDLSAPDPTSFFNLFGLIAFTPPHFLLIGAWPLIYTATMYLQQKMQPSVPDPVQARMMLMMPVIMGLMLASLPAGLLIYYSWNNTLTILQQWLITRRVERADNRVPA